MSWLTVRGIGRKERDRWVLHPMDIDQEPLQRIAIAGEAGSGKTTLLKMIGGMVQPDSGSVHFRGERVLGPLEKLLPVHKGIAYLSQHFELPNHYWVHEILEAVNQLPPSRAAQLYRLCAIDHLLTRRTNELSGGERQRIALCRVLSTAPSLLLLDEPFSNLDASNRALMRNVIESLETELHITAILVSHDPVDALGWAHTIVVLQEGLCIQSGTPSEIYEQPVNAYCAGLFGDYSLIEPDEVYYQSWIPGKFSTGRALILRPAAIQISQNPGLPAAIVTRISYRGAISLLEASLGNTTLKIHCVPGAYHVGETVHLDIDTSRIVTVS